MFNSRRNGLFCFLQFFRNAFCNGSIICRPFTDEINIILNPMILHFLSVQRSTNSISFRYDLKAWSQYVQRNIILWIFHTFNEPFLENLWPKAQFTEIKFKYYVLEFWNIFHLWKTNHFQWY